MNSDLAKLGNSLLEILHSAYENSYYSNNFEYNGPGWEIHGRLFINDLVRVEYREWAEWPYYLTVVKGPKSNILQLDLSNVIIEDNRITWYLSNPTHEESRKQYIELFGAMVNLPPTFREKIRLQKTNLSTGKKPMVDKSGFLLSNALDIEDFSYEFRKFIDQIILPHTGIKAKLKRKDDFESASAFEGYKSDRKVILSKRNAAIVEKRKVMDDYTCQICGFRLEIKGKHIIECHHLKPLANGSERITEISDIISLCPNCHRTVHLKNPPYTPAELKNILNGN
jgi:5-methylcytosine-specific restriction protein A